MAGKTVEEVRERLMNHFKVPNDQHGAQWSALWDAEDIPWDRGQPSPALVDLLSNATATTTTTPATTALKAVVSSATRKRAFVPGCGRGYDVALLAHLGFDAYGIDISARAVGLAENFHENNPKPTAPGGRISFRQGDFFKDEWVYTIVSGEGEDKEAEGAFDLAYDYTFLCALEPSMREDWARRMTHLLKRGSGVLVCLEFPLYKEFGSGGPPWALRSDVYDELLKDTFELVERFAPERTHEIGMGTDRVSVWKRK
ncbi:S-adenosyl-L-methionine-dependent methyltransferase [Peziza echinospora]|nr:S-adenosyl-L-methionine-dependent methyltransferase [Peziza echinospora]